MNRKEFLQLITVAPLTAPVMKLRTLENTIDSFPNTPKMPTLFIGHGHPMNALLDNIFTQTLTQLGERLEKPAAALVISAHWETKGTQVSVNPHPKTIYDFGNFDPRLFQIRYEPAGSPTLARAVIAMAPEYAIQENHSRGIDHGVWTVLKYIFPQADVPVLQLSVDTHQPPLYHYQLGQALKKLRRKGVLVIGSGNIVHNLQMLNWQDMEAKPYDWAIEFDAVVKQRLDQAHFSELVDYQQFGALARASVPTNDHYLPMLYTLGLAEPNEHIIYPFEGFQYAGISMRSFLVA